MELADRVSESVIKILENVKVSVGHDVARWTQDISPSTAVKEQDIPSIHSQSSNGPNEL